MSRIQPILTRNGKLFPSWIIHVFKKYKIPIIDQSNEDMCNLSDHNKNELRQYQKFLWDFLNYESRYNSILLYHGVGSGKSASSINIYSQLYNHDPNWNVIILLPASLKKNWEGYKDILTNKYIKGEVDQWIGENEAENKKKNIKYISYNASNADKQFIDYVHSVDTTKKNLYIIDEAQKFISNVSSNITNEKGQRAKNIYDYMYKQKLNNPETRIILLSGTPIINDPFELALMFNLLRPMYQPLFPLNPEEFKKLFVDTNNDGKIKADRINTFQRRILGLVSYYTFDPRQFAKEFYHNVDITMSEQQQIIYDTFNKIENTINKNGTKNSMYKALTRQSSNFTFPSVNGIDGVKRPRPGDFNISQKEDEDILRKKDKDQNNDNKTLYKNALHKFITATIDYFNELMNKDMKNGKNIQIDIEKILKDYDTPENLNKLLISKILTNSKCSELLKALYECSPKYLALMFNILKSKGPAIVYTNYVLMEGVEMIKIYLDYFGFKKFNENLGNSYLGKRYAEFHGGIDQKERYTMVAKYNDKENIKGDIIKVIFITSAGAEGISLKNVRQCHIVEPHWNESRIIQVIGRGNRLCSHGMLPIEERTIDIFRYKSISKKDEESTDQYIERIAQYKENINKSFLDVIKGAAVDCELNYNINKNVDKDLKCFKFPDNSLINNPGPAFHSNIYEDIEYNSGSNSFSSVITQLKVFKIQCIKQYDKEGTKFSKPAYYWLDKNTGYVYDLEYKYLIGQLKIENNKFIKNDDTFIIDSLVPY
jgi:hypothetical protein